ncbi:hypothetical protein K7X08_029269 [Anisodus acutangulus]|uniref:Uncharacterized protein n=1 Tax=Anisodus acutangulus TaxID=402998 RepID=A0A9Q1L4V7_9SOLA|nr:hypothetical protein K7X08_029269 [Anisodus acutangulus]
MSHIAVVEKIGSQYISARPLATTDKENTILLSSKDVTFLNSDISKTEGRIVRSENNGRDDEENKGKKVIISFQEGAQVKMLRRQSRLILESPPSAQHEEEAVNSVEIDPVEDVVVMDYAQPHRKPPIHNMKH